MNNIKLLKNLELINIWMFSYDEGNDNELILDCNRVLFDLKNYELSIEDRDGKIIVTINQKNEIYSSCDIIKIDLRNILLEFSETNYYLKKIGLINFESSSGDIFCDALDINLISKNYGSQNIFIHSGIYGLRIRSSDYYKNNWIKNWYVPLYGNNLHELWVF